MSSPLEILTLAQLASLNNSFLKQSWTPTLTSGGTSPTGYTAVGYYIQVGDLIIAQGSITSVAGAFTTTGSTGSWLIPLPVSSALTGTYGVPVGNSRVYQTSAGDAICQALSASNGFELIHNTTSTATQYVSATAPWTWTTAAMAINFTCTYPAATP